MLANNNRSHLLFTPNPLSTYSDMDAISKKSPFTYADADNSFRLSTASTFHLYI
jgi:hypothetical protein